MKIGDVMIETTTKIRDLVIIKNIIGNTVYYQYITLYGNPAGPHFEGREPILNAKRRFRQLTKLERAMR